MWEHQHLKGTRRLQFSGVDGRNIEPTDDEGGLSKDPSRARFELWQAILAPSSVRGAGKAVGDYLEKRSYSFDSASRDKEGNVVASVCLET
jgi:hypothetical protein